MSIPSIVAPARPSRASGPLLATVLLLLTFLAGCSSTAPAAATPTRAATATPTQAPVFGPPTPPTVTPAPLPTAAGTAGARRPVDLTILHTNDVMGEIDPCG